MGIRSIRSLCAATRVAATLLVLITGLALVACGDPGASSSSSLEESPSPGSATASPVSTPSPAATAASWRPGDDSLAATAKVAARWRALLRTERFAASDIWSPHAALDIWAFDVHATDAGAVKAVYTNAAPGSSWTAGHQFVAPGVAAWEGLYAGSGQKASPALDLLAVSGGRVTREDVYLDASGGERAAPVAQWPSPPARTDTIARTKKTAEAFADAMTDSGTLRLGRLLADDLLFYDTAQNRPQRGATALLLWWNSRTFAIAKPKADHGVIAGRGWAAVRWTATGGQTSTDEIAMPGVTVLEIRDGKVVRMTLYYDSATLALHM